MIAVRIVEARELDRRPPTVVDVRFHEFDVYIGRRSPRARDRRCHRRSVWANPYGLGAFGGRGGCVEKYRSLMRLRLGLRPAEYGEEVFSAEEIGRWRERVLALGTERDRAGCFRDGGVDRGHGRPAC